MANVTSIEELMGYGLTDVVELPPFAPGKPLVVRLKKPSMLDIAASGQLPNGLLATAVTLFNEGKKVEDEIRKDGALVGKFGQVLEIFVKNALVEPSYQQLKDAHIDLTDEQKMAIFSYTQEDAEKLVPFRKNKGSTKTNKSSKNVQGKALRPIKG